MWRATQCVHESRECDLHTPLSRCQPRLGPREPRAKATGRSVPAGGCDGTSHCSLPKAHPSLSYPAWAGCARPGCELHTPPSRRSSPGWTRQSRATFSSYRRLRGSRLAIPRLEFMKYKRLCYIFQFVISRVIYDMRFRRTYTLTNPWRIILLKKLGLKPTYQRLLGGDIPRLF